jgi:hypothetical protein
MGMSYPRGSTSTVPAWPSRLWVAERLESMALRESMEGWPLLTLETEANGDSKSTNERGPSFAALVGLVQNIFFLAIHYFNAFVPIAQQAGQAVVLVLLGHLCLLKYDSGSTDPPRALFVLFHFNSPTKKVQCPIRK